MIGGGGVFVQNGPLPKLSSIRRAQFQNGSRAETVHIKNDPLLWSYSKINILFFFFTVIITKQFFFHSDVNNDTNFGDMNRERMSAKCKFVGTFLPVDLYSSPT